MTTSTERLRDNPFFVLGLPPDAPRAEIERTGQRLLGELALGREAAATYATPLGPQPRTEERVRAAIAELRDPARRIVHEVWAEVPTGAAPPPPVAWPWSLVERLLGVRRR
jgi:hypothetical protein